MHRSIPTAPKKIFSATDLVMKKPRKLSAFPAVGNSFTFDGLGLLICLEGSIRVKINYKEFKVSKNQVLVIVPYQIVTVLDVDKKAYMAALFIGKDYLMHVPKTNIDFDRMLKLEKYPVVTLTPDEMKNLMELHAVTLVRYRKINDPYTEICVGGLLFALLAEIGSIYAKNKPVATLTQPSRQEKITEDFFRLLLQHFQEERSVAYYADKMCFSPKYLSKVVKQVTGHTIQDWINEIVVVHIKNLLKTTDKTVLEISEDMNFSNPSFFGRFFKQYAGMTPRQFRFNG